LGKQEYAVGAGGGKIELREEVNLPEGERIPVVLLPDDECPFWREASTSSLPGVGDYPQDKVYARVLEK
jgi:hypothetical protein